jgi:hypothetical protein
MLAAMGLISAPGVAPGGGSNKTEQTAVAENVGAKAIEIAETDRQMRHFYGWGRQHPVWLGRAKHGKGRKSGTRSRWDYRR